MKSIIKLPVLLWVFFSLLVYSSILISPLTFKYSGLISFGIPFVILLNFLLLILSAVFKSKFGWVALFLIVCGWPFVNVGISIGGNNDLSQGGIKVMNYNIMRFNYDQTTDVNNKIISWIEKNDADIICIQEFAATNANLNSLKGINDYYAALGGYANSFAIFSKHPIINSGALYEVSSTNNITFADLIIDIDTIRVYNVHLQSMGINPEKIQTTDGIKEEYESVKNKFISGSVDRARQIADLLDHSANCNYPILIAGDFNDVPFSHNYFSLRKQFANAFEKKGSGLGATFNNKLPFLRIDNQFYSNDFNLKAFQTGNNTYYSDHFPLIGIYELSD